MLCSRHIETIYNKLPCIFVLNVHIFLKLCQHVMNFNVPGIHYIFTFSASLILGINNFQCSLDIQDLVFNIALFYYLGIFSTWLCTIITGNINNNVISFGFAFTVVIHIICPKKWILQYTFFLLFEFVTSLPDQMFNKEKK